MSKRHLLTSLLHRPLHARPIPHYRLAAVSRHMTTASLTPLQNTLPYETIIERFHSGTDGKAIESLKINLWHAPAEWHSATIEMRRVAIERGQVNVLKELHELGAINSQQYKQDIVAASYNCSPEHAGSVAMIKLAMSEGAGFYEGCNNIDNKPSKINNRSFSKAADYIDYLNMFHQAGVDLNKLLTLDRIGNDRKTIIQFCTKAAESSDVEALTKLHQLGIDLTKIKIDDTNMIAVASRNAAAKYDLKALAGLQLLGANLKGIATSRWSDTSLAHMLMAKAAEKGDDALIDLSIQLKLRLDDKHIIKILKSFPADTIIDTVIQLQNFEKMGLLAEHPYLTDYAAASFLHKKLVDTSRISARIEGFSSKTISKAMTGYIGKTLDIGDIDAIMTALKPFGLNIDRAANFALNPDSIPNFKEKDKQAWYGAIALELPYKRHTLPEWTVSRILHLKATPDQESLDAAMKHMYCDYTIPMLRKLQQMGVKINFDPLPMSHAEQESITAITRTPAEGEVKQLSITFIDKQRCEKFITNNQMKFKKLGLEISSNTHIRAERAYNVTISREHYNDKSINMTIYAAAIEPLQKKREAEHAKAR